MAIEGFKLATVAVNFSGSVLSAMGSGFILLCYLALPMRRHFRHVLIINLAIADFINSLNNSISGSIILYSGKDLTNGPGCVLNGLVGQVSVQAGDCAIFAVAIITVYTITRTSHFHIIQAEWEWKEIVAVTAAIWFLPFVTGFLALAMSWYVPVSGNWCWIIQKPLLLRFALTHIWRYLFMICEIGLYIALHLYLRRHFRRLAVPIVSRVSTSEDESEDPVPLTTISFHARESGESKQTLHASSPGSMEKAAPSTYTQNRDPFMPDKPGSASSAPVSSTPRPKFRRITPPRENLHDQSNSRQRAIQRVLLLNAYPLLYIVLWIPGLANRAVEGAGGSSRALQILQASTQFVGLANALTYGWNERIWKQLQTKYRWRF